MNDSVSNPRPFRDSTSVAIAAVITIAWTGCSLDPVPPGRDAGRGASPAFSEPREREASSSPFSSADPRDQLARLARLVGSDWRVGFGIGHEQFERYDWGPGGFSLHNQSFGRGGGGEPWRALQVFYWHPERDEMALLALSPYLNGVAEGSVQLNQDSLQAEYDLYQRGNRREMVLRWQIADDRYHSTLWEVPRPPAPGWNPSQPPLGVWEYVRVPAGAARATDAGESERPKGPRWRSFLRLFDHTWRSISEGAGSGERSFESTVEWIPYAEALFVQIFSRVGAEDPEHWFDAYVYHHSLTDSVHCLVLSDSGDLWEGTWSVPDEDVLELELATRTGGVFRVEFDVDETVRTQLWIQAGMGREAVSFNARHQRSKRAGR